MPRPAPAESTDPEDALLGGSCPAVLELLHSIEKHFHHRNGYRVRKAMDFVKPRCSGIVIRPHPGVKQYPCP